MLLPGRRAILGITLCIALGTGFAVGWAQAPVENAAAENAANAPAPTAAAETAPKPAATKKPAEPEPGMTPYSVLVRLNVPVDPQIDSAFRNALATSVKTQLRTAMGQMWTTEVTVAADARLASLAALSAVRPDDVTSEFEDGAYDKVFLGSVDLSGSRWSLAAREWDAASRTLGPVVSESTFDVRNAGVLLADAVQRSFRPLARIESVERGVVVTAIRGGEFPPGDPSAMPFKAGDLLIPFVRYYDRERVLQQIRELPWTYLRVNSVERARMECETVSAYRTPLSGSRRRMELLAIAARPAYPATRLVIAPRGNAADPLPGCRIELLNRLPTADDPVDDREKLLTDRLGSIVVSADPEHPLKHVLVHSGRTVLGRVPIIPGMAETVTLAIPDDSARLSVEGSLSVLEGELIDAVASRAVLMARSRLMAKARRWEELDSFLEQLDSVPTYAMINQRVMAMQLPAVQAAKAQNDRVAESRIKKMCSDVLQAAAGHLDADKLREFKIEMLELKAAAK